MNILRQIEKFETSELPRLKKLHKYYLGKNHIMERQAKDTGKPDFRISNNYAKSIVNTTIGYYMGKPITYKIEDEQLKEQIEHITTYNDDDLHNASIANDLSIFGVAYELLYLDEDKEIRYTKLSPMETIVKYNNDIDKTIKYVIRFYDVVDDDGDNTTRFIELYDKDNIYKYRVENELIPINKIPNCFSEVPINVYQNNEDKQGDFENVISLIDAMDIMQSENLNDFVTFADAYLCMSNIDVSEEDASKLRDNKLLVLGENGQAQWLVKDVNDSYVENQKNRLDKDIYKFSQTTNMSDENFAGNSSGVAIAYKTMNMETRIANTQRYFEKGLARRMELICSMLNLTGGNYDYTSISYVFVRNTPINLSELATQLQQLEGLVSKKTLLAQVPFVDDVDLEMKKLEDESDNKNIFENMPITEGIGE